MNKRTADLLLTDRALAELQQQNQRRVLRLFHRHEFLSADAVETMQAWEHVRGFSVNAEVWVPSWDRAGLERLIRYCARPLGERLAWLEPEQRLVYRVPEPRLGGQTALGLTPISLVDEAPPQAHPLTMWSTDPIEFLVRLSVADRHGVTSCHRSCADVKFPHLGCQLSNG